MVLDKLDAIEAKQSLGNLLSAGETTDQTKLTFTPVTTETFAVWCETYMKRLQDERIARLGDIDNKPTGKQLFLMNKNAFDDLTLEEEDEGDEDYGAEESKDQAFEEEKKEESEEEAEFKYDRALYDPDGIDDDVDFDDDDN